MARKDDSASGSKPPTKGAGLHLSPERIEYERLLAVLHGVREALSEAIVRADLEPESCPPDRIGTRHVTVELRLEHAEELLLALDRALSGADPVRHLLRGHPKRAEIDIRLRAQGRPPKLAFQEERAAVGTFESLRQWRGMSYEDALAETAKRYRVSERTVANILEAHAAYRDYVRRDFEAVQREGPPKSP